MMHGYWGVPGGFGWFGNIFMLFFWVLIIGGIFWAIRMFGMSHCCREEAGERPLDILKKRYAKGDITKEEYLTKKQELGL